jgi:hypothetical protein
VNGAGPGSAGYNNGKSFAGKLRIRHAVNWIAKRAKTGDIETMHHDRITTTQSPRKMTLPMAHLIPIIVSC